MPYPFSKSASTFTEKYLCTFDLLLNTLHTQYDYLLNAFYASVEVNIVNMLLWLKHRGQNILL